MKNPFEQPTIENEEEKAENNIWDELLKDQNFKAGAEEAESHISSEWEKERVIAKKREVEEALKKLEKEQKEKITNNAEDKKVA